MQRSECRILTTHVGSLVRTPEIIQAMEALDQGMPYDEQTYRDDLRQGVADAVRRQAEVGIDVVSDGEYGKRGWSQYVIERFTGLEPEQREESRTFMDRGPREGRFVDFWSRYRKLETVIWLPEHAFGNAVRAGKLGSGLTQTAWVCTGPVTYRGHDAVARDIENFKAALGTVEVVEAFMPVVAPCSAEVTRENRYYDSDEDYLSAVAAALREEYRAIVDAGLLLQGRRRTPADAVQYDGRPGAGRRVGALGRAPDRRAQRGAGGDTTRQGAVPHLLGQPECSAPG